MIQTRNISDADLLAVKALWETLCAKESQAPDDDALAYLVKHNKWAIAENDGKLCGFGYWHLDGNGNAHLRAAAVQTEASFLSLVLACASASEKCVHGILKRNRPEKAWLANIGAAMEPYGYAPMTPAEEAKFKKLAEKLAARTPVIDRITISVSLIPAIKARLEVL